MASKAKAKKGNEEAARICKELGCSKLFINTKREYFTEYTYALASEGGDKKKVEMYEDRTEVEEVETPIAEEKKADEVNKPENTNGNE